MEQILKRTIEELNQGNQATLVTVIAAQGSTPREAGASMVVGKSGLLAGTVGGGLIEHRCVEHAMEKLGATTGWTEHFVLDNDQAGSLGMICGGNTQVLFTPLHSTKALEELLESAAEIPVLYLPLDGGAPSVGDGVKNPQVVQWRGASHIALPLVSGGRIFLIGGGHVAVETAHLLDRLEFRHYVVDDRDEFCSTERFPGALRTVVIPFEQLGAVFCGQDAPRAGDGFCIMTRGHLGDTQAVRFALSTQASYIGVMGSRRKREKVLSQLESEGFLDVRQRVTTPIGLDIGAQTPAELAVSVVAQLIQWRGKT